MTDQPPVPGATRAAADRLVADAIALRRAGRADAAADCFRQALAHEPNHPGALTSFAMLMLDGDDVQAALRLAERAVGADPGRAGAYHALGRAQCRMGRFNQGIATLRQALALDPESFELHLELGSALQAVDLLDAAQTHLRRACDLAPELAAPRVNLANLYRRQQRPGEAVALYRRALALDEGVAQTHNNLGTLLAELGDGDAAVEAFRRALALAPDRPTTWSNLLLALNWSDRISAAALAAAHRAYGEHFGRRIHPLAPVAMPPLAGRRLRIGYLSSDFCSHAVALFVLPLLERHDRGRFAIHAYHNRNADDEITGKLRSLVDHFLPVASLSDNELAQRIRADGIDILVDLNGHTANNRLPLFLLKPAPVQLTWLGYLATSGLATMDYRLTDPRADPPGMTEALHTETLWRLPATLWCYQPYGFAPAGGPLPAQRNGHVTFGSLGNPGKVSPGVLELWIRILRVLPDARLVMITGGYEERNAAVLRRFEQGGIAAPRVERLPRQSTPDYLAAYRRIDIVLDTWPSAGGTTTCDALWMGVPVVSLAGERSFSRSGASMLASVGLPELVAEQPEDYVATAVTLAQDIPRLASLRATLRERMRASPLCDAAGFARAVEAAYVAMAERATGAPGISVP